MHYAWSQQDGGTMDEKRLSDVEFGRWVQKERLARGWSQDELAKKVKLSQATIARIERAQIETGDNNRRALALAFGKTTSGVSLHLIEGAVDDIGQLEREEKELIRLFRRVEKKRRDELLSFVSLSVRAHEDAAKKRPKK